MTTEQEKSGWRWTLRHSIPNYVGTVGGGLTLLFVAWLWTGIVSGFAYAFARFGWWTLAGFAGLALLVLWGVMLFARRRGPSADFAASSVTLKNSKEHTVDIRAEEFLPFETPALEVGTESAGLDDGPYRATYDADSSNFAQTFMITTTVASFFLGAWPTKFNPDRIALSNLQSTAKNIQVSISGFRMPYEIVPPFVNLEDGVQRIVDKKEDWIREEYRLHSSGLLTLVRVNPEDVRDQNNYAAPRVMGLLFLIKAITAMTLAARNLARQLLDDNDELSIDISIGGLIGRVLFNDAPELFAFAEGPACHLGSFHFPSTINRRDFESKAGELATDCILKVLWLFNQGGLSRSTIEDCQRRWVEKREPMAFPERSALVSKTMTYGPRLSVKLSDETRPLPPYGTNLVGYLENIGDETARDVRLWFPQLPKDGRFDLNPGQRRDLCYKWERRRDDHIGGDYQQYAIIEFSGESSIYQQKAVVAMPLDQSMSYRTYRLEYDGVPTVVDDYTFQV